jgi:hypothetical protein
VHCPSAVQVVGHAVVDPLQTYGVHEGLPGEVTGTVSQVPTEPETLHAWQGPAVHALLQHTPLEQYPVSHWSAAVHAVPLAKLPEQKPRETGQLPFAHWRSSVQEAPLAWAGTHVLPVQ